VRGVEEGGSGNLYEVGAAGLGWSLRIPGNYHTHTNLATMGAGVWVTRPASATLTTENSWSSQR